MFKNDMFCLHLTCFSKVHDSRFRRWSYFFLFIFRILCNGPWWHYVSKEWFCLDLHFLIQAILFPSMHQPIFELVLIQTLPFTSTRCDLEIQLTTRDFQHTENFMSAQSGFWRPGMFNLIPCFLIKNSVFNLTAQI